MIGTCFCYAHFYIDDVGGKRYFEPMIPTDCYELSALAILKHLFCVKKLQNAVYINYNPVLSWKIMG